MQISTQLSREDSSPIAPNPLLLAGEFPTPYSLLPTPVFQKRFEAIALTASILQTVIQRSMRWLHYRLPINIHL